MSASEGIKGAVGRWAAGGPGVMGGSWFAAFRALLGLYLFVHAAELVPYAAELFSREGVLPDPAQNLLPPVFPSVLRLWDSAEAAFTLVASMAALSIALALGWRRRLVSLLLWYGWACLFNRNNLIANPSLPYVGLLLLVVAAAPPGEPRDPTRPSRWRLPRDLERVVAFLLFAGYTYSGWTKLPAPSWVDGSALAHVLALPLARDLWLRELLLDQPSFLRLATWGALALELAALPLALAHRTRAWAWLLTTALQLGLLLLMDFTDLTLGMLLAHAFVAPWALARAPGRTLVRRHRAIAPQALASPR